MLLQEKETITFDDVHLVPQYSDIESRSEVSLTATLKNSKVKMRLPIFASPMDTISGPKLATVLWKEAGGIAILHRYCSAEHQAQMVREVVATDSVVGAAVGSGGDFIERAQLLVDCGIQVLCVDVAHGHHKMVGQAVTKLRKLFPNIHLMAGNVATKSGFKFLQEAGADSIRVNVGGGSICSTRIQTGHGYPALQSVLEIASMADRTAQIVLDGGMKYYGDAVKGLAAGSDLLMSGAFFAGTDEALGKEIIIGGKKVREYRGMSSKAAQMEWRKSWSSNEGVEAVVESKGGMREICGDLTASLRSGFSYSGARTIAELQKRAVFARVSSAAALEATPHVFMR